MIFINLIKKKYVNKLNSVRSWNSFENVLKHTIYLNTCIFPFSEAAAIDCIFWHAVIAVTGPSVTNI